MLPQFDILDIMTDENLPEKKSVDVEGIASSSIFRIISVILLCLGYYIFLSPFVEKFFIKQISSIMRARSTPQVNVLSPVYDVYADSKGYDLSLYERKNPGTVISKTKFFTIDPRVLAMNKFLTHYHSPMAGSSRTFVEEADKHGLDWRLLAAISGVESAFGNLVPRGTNNAWGWRGINGNEAGWSMFESWDSAIRHITERFARGYGTTLTPFEIEPIYCPPCGANPAHAWANGVTRFMIQLQYYLDNLERV